MKIGLVLGGGGSRGFAHIGVLQVLHREQIPIDFIVGTSMGAIAGVLYALGLAPDEIAAGMQQEINKANPSRPLNRLSLLTSTARQRRLQRLIEPAVGDRTFADLTIPVTVMAVDMLLGQEVEIREGPLLPTLLASCAVPGVFPPVEIDGRQLSDGGVIDSLATHVAVSQRADKIIAVDVYPILEQDTPWIDPIYDIIGLQWTANFFSGGNGGNRRVPHMASVMWRSVRVMTWHLHQKRLEEHRPDIYLRPSVDALGSLDFKDLSESVAAGAHEAEKYVDELRALAQEKSANG